MGRKILHCVITIFVLIITNASSQVHDCTSQEAAGVVCSSCRCGLEGSRRIVGGVESTVSCFHFSECDRFVTSPLWSEWEISVDRSTQLLHNRRNQSRQDLSLVFGFKNIISSPEIIIISYVADATRWVCWHSDIFQLGSHCCSLCRVSCKDQLNIVWVRCEC